MQVTLRKANAIQNSINEALKALEFNTDVSINQFQTVETVIQDASSVFRANLERRTKLVSTLYEIRKNVAKANSSSGIDSMLADVARQEKDLVFFSTLAKKQSVTDSAVLQGKLKKISERKENDYYHKDEVETSILSKQDIAEYNSTAASLKKAKQKLQDELLELNVRTVITLSDDAVKTLTDENII